MAYVSIVTKEMSSIILGQYYSECGRDNVKGWHVTKSRREHPEITFWRFI
jgi:hypothetical protein